MQIFKRFFSLSLVLRITAVVIAAHLAVAIALVCHHLFTYRFTRPRPIVIRTIIQQASKPLPAVVTKQTSPQTRKSTPPQKKENAPPASKKVSKSQPKKSLSSPAKKPAPKEKKLLEELSQSLDAIAHTPPPAPKRPALLLPSAIPMKTEIAATLSEEDPTYGEMVVAFLQSALDLPEYGTVRAEIEIGATGQLLSVEILESESLKNGEFLKKNLPTLTFPCFNRTGKHSYTITFRNVENH